MIKKRLIGVVTVKNNIAVQSFSYNNYLPLGKPECVVENLDRWGADEILIQIIDRSKNNLGPDFELLKKIGQLKLSTPVIYSGGIRNNSDAVRVIKYGADRIAIDSLLRKNQKDVLKISNSLGTQAIIGSLPFCIKEDRLFYFDYLNSSYIRVNKELIESYFNSKYISEILLINKDGEGIEKSFNTNIIELLPDIKTDLIVFGGISQINQIDKLFKFKNISAIGVGNFLNYKEHSIQLFKEKIKFKNIRKANYQRLNFNANEIL